MTCIGDVSRRPEKICHWCKEEVSFDPEKGWVHASDGELYRGRYEGDVWVDDHCVLPVDADFDESAQMFKVYGSPLKKNPDFERHREEGRQR